MSGYIGNIPVPQATQTRQSFTATASQTTFNTAGYTAGFIDVFLNGIKLVDGTDYTATNGSDVVLTTGAAVSDVLDVVMYAPFDVVNTSLTDATINNTLTLKNATEEDTDGGRESTIIFKGEQSGGEISTLAEIEASHDGTADDEKGDLIFRTNDGSDGSAPTERLRIDSLGDISFYEDTGTTAKFFWDASAERLGIGDASPSVTLDVTNNSGSNNWINASQSARFYQADSTNPASIKFQSANNANGGQITWGGVAGDGPFMFKNYGTERMRIDSSGNLLVGKTVNNNTTTGIKLDSQGYISASIPNDYPLILNRTSSDGAIAVFRKDGTTVGSIATHSGAVIGINLRVTTSKSGFRGAASSIIPWYEGSDRDNQLDLGTSGVRWDDVYATNGTIQTSDQNEKQQIASLTDAEITAAKAISKLFKTFKWNDSVAEKGDAARIHTGVIAQEVEQAMTDAGLNAGDYAFFISTTWWETQTEVPAVEADEENGVEAQEAYTRTDTYETAEEAPEGATERNRKGIRYPQLLSFIGAATEQRLASIESRLDALENPA